MLTLKWNDHLLTCTESQVTLNGKEIVMPRMERRLLQFMLENPNVALFREQLLREVWGYEVMGETRTVDSHIKRLRADLGVLGSRIVTVRGVGYRLELPQLLPVYRGMSILDTQSCGAAI